MDADGRAALIARESRPPLILVVEDDADLSKLVQSRLQGIGFETAEARCGLAALHYLTQNQPDLILLDYYLPDMLGDELLERMAERGLKIPFVVATGHGTEVVAVEMMKHGARDYLIKDLTFLRLLPAVVQKTLQQLEQERRLRDMEAQIRANEEEIRRAHDELELRVRERTAELANANVRLRVEMDERRRAEDQARQHQADVSHLARLTSLGEMVAEVAHELNQPLSAIANYSAACQRLAAGDYVPREIHDAMAQVVDQASRAAEVVQRLQRFASKTTPVRGSVAVNELVDEILLLLEAEIRLARVEVHVRTDNELPRALADARQIEQVLVNLLRNAIEALRDPERLPREICIRTARRGDLYVEISVQDSGIGPPDHIAESMFERFVTTKRDAAGLGLSISRTIIEAHGGELWFERAGEGGAVFRLTLPVEGGAAAHEH